MRHLNSHRRKRHSITRLAAGAAACSFLAHAALAQAPDVIYLTGTVRDFRQSHSDFDVTPSGGNGHYARNVSTVSPMNEPLFTGDGYKVNTQWRDTSGANIPPHLYYNGGTLLLVSQPTQAQNSVIDSWNSADGTYGGSNVGPQPPTLVGAPMPSISAPTGLPQTYGPNPNFLPVNNGLAANTWTSNFKCNSLTTQQNAVITVVGDVTVSCTGNFTLSKSNRIDVLPGSILRLYVGGALSVNQGSEINMNTFATAPNPWACLIYITGSSTFTMSQNTKVCAKIVAPNAILQLDQNDHFYGTYIGKQIKLDQGSGFHWDGIPLTLCSNLVADNPGAEGVASTAAINSSSSFGEWYHDVAGANLSASHTIALTRNGGVYEYLDNAFFPIDGRLFGNEGANHNYFFTYNVSAAFTFDGCATSPQFIEFTGADDVWIYIDGKLAMDLGGIIPMTTQRVHLDRMGLVNHEPLVDGQAYTMHFYFAQRNPTTSVFRLRTNLELESNTPLSITAAFD